ncbi:MAG: NUDIX hydrolase [Synechococcaceae cyanobacterium]
MVDGVPDPDPLRAAELEDPRASGLPWVALALLEVEGRWLLQLRDDVEGIAAPGTWGLFGGHLDPGESPEQALRRELIEEINYEAEELRLWCHHRNAQRLASYFLGQLTVPLRALTLLEGQDLTLATPAELRSGWIHSLRLGEARPLAPSLLWAVNQLESCLWRPTG